MSDLIGDNMSPPLKQDAGGFYFAVDQGFSISANGAPVTPVPSKSSNLGKTFENRYADPSATTCKQKIWFSFFFDGTGNNMDADLGTLKHSNVVRLYRAHKGIDPGKQKGKVSPDGIYRLYIPGVGTYFRDVGDPGGTTLGGGCGDQGDDRLKWAKDRFYDAMMPHFARAQNPQNEILEINISAFGFSRGAALARACMSRFFNIECSKVADHLVLKEGKYKVNLKFLGIFDTVASVGLPLSTNNTSVLSLAGSLWLTTHMRLIDDHPSTRPEDLAFADHGLPGADPSPGTFNGHQSWGGEMAIPKQVEEVRHFVAGHEIRNSFPVDSASILRGKIIDKPPNFHETVYPGVHSDVGGSYRPGEGTKSFSSDDKIGLIAGGNMYDFALAKGLPFLPRTAWAADNINDFKVNAKTLEVYNYYLSKVSASGVLGDLFNSHMGLYYAWRFRAIHLKQKGDTTEADKITKNDAIYAKEAHDADSQIAGLDKNLDQASRDDMHASMDVANYQQTHGMGPGSQTPYDSESQAARQKVATADDAELRAKARKGALPPAGVLEDAIKFYDKRLMKDAEAIYSAYSSYFWSSNPIDAAKRAKLRPHYRAMMDAYENEFKLNKGLSDPKLIDFFDNYVHDSLAGFAQDATLPSDPRVIYLGGEQKYEYAMLDSNHSDYASMAA